MSHFLRNIHANALANFLDTSSRVAAVVLTAVFVATQLVKALP
jgi:hypothetical protein